LTRKQRQVLNFIERFWEEHDYSPSYREISDVEGTALSHTYAIVSALTDKGFIHKERGRARAIYPIPVWRHMRHETDISDAR
jgi:SOS-response transcriptional repressor LexA